jgi:two-component system sensor histidine kinase YesM
LISLQSLRSRWQRLLLRPLPFLLLLALLPMGGLSFFVYSYTNSNLEKEIGMLNTQSLNKSKDALDTVFREIDRLAVQLSLEESVRYFLLAHDADSLHNAQYKSIIGTMSMFSLIYDYIDSIYIYSDSNNNALTSTWRGPIEQLTDNRWYEEYLRNKDQPVDRWYQSRKLRKEDSEYPYLISLFRPVKLYPPQSVGLIVINIDVEKLGRLMGNMELAASRDFFITDPAGTVFYNSDLHLISRSIRELPFFLPETLSSGAYSKLLKLEGQKQFLTVLESAEFQWRYISVVPLEFNMEKKQGLLAFILIFLLLYVAVSVVLSGLVKTAESKRRLKEKLKLNQLTLDKVQAQALQSQINPHFLHNTLETIRIMLIKATGTLHSPAETMLTALSEMLRISMETKEYLIPLSDEIEHCQRYLDIIQIRYQGKFAVEWLIPGELRHHPVLKLSLQPLIENAIHHGIKPSERKGLIRISASLEGEELVIEVEDNGVGMSREQMELLNVQLRAKCEVDDSHLGLNNVNQRVKLIFGNSCGLSILSGLEQGTTVRMVFPATS